MNKRYELSNELPVILVVYNRPRHTTEVLNALRLHGVQKLWVYCDAPKTAQHQATVEETRRVIDTIDWTTPKVTIQEHNKGLAKSIREAVDSVFQDEDFVILLEDDCVPERWFFRYMHEIYQRYHDDRRIFGASGYTVQHPREVLKNYSHDVYFVPRIGSWGWGTWKDRWQFHERDLHQVIHKCQEGGIDLEQGGSDILQTLHGLLNGSVKDVWTLHWVLSTYLHKAFYAYPTVSHVRNIGMDGSGVHCGPTDQFETEIAKEQPTRFPESVVLDEPIYKSFRFYYDVPNTAGQEQGFQKLKSSLSPNQPDTSEKNPVPVKIATEDTPLITHIIEAHSLGGAGRAMLSLAKYTKRIRPYKHQVVSLRPVEQSEALTLAQEHGVEVLQPKTETEINSIIENSDIVQLHWWHNPHLDLLLRSKLPAARILSWFHVGGHVAPQRLTSEIVEYVDFALPCSPYTAKSSAILSLPPEERIQKVDMAYGCADFERLDGLTAKEHSTCNVGYIGTLNFLKMHPDFVELCAGVKDENVHFHLWGGGGCEQVLLEQAIQKGIQYRFHLNGYARDILEPLSVIDIFGYPLCEDTYAAAEVVLQEVMYAGIVPVVFPYGGIQDLVVDNFTGLVVRSKLEYAEAIEFLSQNKAERERLGKNAHEYAKQLFGAENAAIKVDEIYQKMLLSEKKERVWPKREQRLQNKGYPEGALLFLETLGKEGEIFYRSLSETNTETLLALEEEIKQISPLLRSGGIESYRASFQTDPYLNYWCGLANMGAGRLQSAINDLTNAIQSGFPHWRALWHLALCLESAGLQKEAQEVFDAVKREAPTFQAVESHLR